MINVSICLTDIPKEKITTSEKNGKKYLNIVVDQRKEVSQYGETHTVYISQTKEQREAKEQKVYLGGGKEYKFENKEQPTQKQSATVYPPIPPSIASEKEEDLPF